MNKILLLRNETFTDRVNSYHMSFLSCTTSKLCKQITWIKASWDS